MKWLFVCAILVFAGCVQPNESIDASVTPGQSYDFAEGLVTYFGGEPRFRVPGTHGHDSANLWLQKQVRDAGWTLEVQEFSGADYEAFELRDQQLAYWQQSCGAEKSEVESKNFTNIIARYDHPSSDVKILLGAHWDSKEDARDGGAVLGANDGASGVGVLLSLMRDYAPAGDVTIVFFDGEDGFEDCHPLAGSMYHARTMTDGPDAMILLDMVGDSTASFMLEQNSAKSAPELQGLLWLRGEERLPNNFVRTTAPIYDDHIPFIQEGVPSVDLIDYGNGFQPYWHTSLDTMENLDSDFMDAIQSIIQYTLDDWFQMQNA